MEDETYDGEPIIMNTLVLGSFQQNDRGKWTRLTKRVNFHATVCRKLDTYRLDGGLLKIN